MWQQMEQPVNPALHDIYEIPDREPDTSDANTWEVPGYSYAGWYANTFAGTPGYNWAQTITYDNAELTNVSDIGLYHHTIRRVHAAQLCQTAIEPMLAAGGIVSSIDSRTRGHLKETQYHVRLAPACDLVQPLNQALTDYGRGIKVEPFEGGEYPASYFMDRFAEDGTFLFSTDPFLNEHDLLYHGLGWFALPDSIVIGGFQKRARQLALIRDTQQREHQQIAYMRQLDHGINVISINSLLKRSYYAESIAKLALQSADEVRAALQQHLYTEAA